MPLHTQTACLYVITQAMKHRAFVKKFVCMSQLLYMYVHFLPNFKMDLWKTFTDNKCSWPSRRNFACCYGSGVQQTSQVCIGDFQNLVCEILIHWYMNLAHKVIHRPQCVLCLKQRNFFGSVFTELWLFAFYWTCLQLLY